MQTIFFSCSSLLKPFIPAAFQLAFSICPHLLSSLSEVSLGKGLPFISLGNHTLRAGILPAPAPALSVWTPMYYRVYQNLPASLPASFSQNCSQCVGTLSIPSLSLVKGTYDDGLNASHGMASK